MRNKKKKYYIIYLSLGDHSEKCGISKIFTIVESEEVAKDWCSRNSEYYYIEKICE